MEGLQAEYVRVPFASHPLIPAPGGRRRRPDDPPVGHPAEVFGAAESHPIGAATSLNLAVRMGDADRHATTPPLLDDGASGIVDPTRFITQQVGTTSAIEAYETFDRREEGWLRTEPVVSEG